MSVVDGCLGSSRQQRQTQSTSGPDQSQLTVRVEEGTPLAEIIHEASFVRCTALLRRSAVRLLTMQSQHLRVLGS
ncbi:hypothetical protein J6590_086414 [Homalodisca vitripennis]|nr:hypothetical protein J6590_086414 [Homalodisca vitripennis]